MKQVDKLSEDELRKERKLFRMILLPAYILVAITALYFIWETSFGSEALLMLFGFITVTLPFALRSGKIHKELRS